MQLRKESPKKSGLPGSLRYWCSTLQLSYQANWELVIKLVRDIPGKDEDEIMNI